jgi:methionine synthase II (cobalamin-independent)
VYQPYRKERPSVEEISIGLDAISLATHSIQAKTIVHTYFGDASPVIPALLELDIDGIGFDIFETEYSKFDLETDKILSLGVVDARDSNIEEPEWIASKTDEILEHVCSENVILTSNLDLKFVPWNIATDKVTSLAKAHAILEEN